MSLSQKHSGLILVPWFSSDEWQYVYRSLSSKDQEVQLKSLELLKIWKLRTPILPAGVEGTLIVLDALLTDTEQFSDEQIINLYAVALMRFLNLSAANSEKQGSFTRMSFKNDLPKWLINLRHDIAHGHQIPSKANLKMGLDYGFNWLKERYWKPQSKIIKDHYIDDDFTTNETLLNILNIYINLNLTIFQNNEQDKEYIEQIRDVIYKRFKRRISDPYLMLEILEEVIRQSLENDLGRNVNKFLQILVSNDGILKPNFEIVSEEEGNEKIDKSFRNIWKNLFNLLHHRSQLFCVVNKLFDTVDDISYSENAKKMASMWIKEIFLSLQRLKELDSSQESLLDCIHLDSNITLYKEESLEFQRKVLYHETKFSAYFIDELLEYNENSIAFTKDALNLLKCETDIEHTPHGIDNKIYNLEDLKVENLSIDDIKFIDISENITKISDSFESASKQIIGENKWKKVEDTSVFKDCPLGILPHQVNETHPFLILV